MENDDAADAKRWRAIRNLMQISSCHMGGQHTWYMRQPRFERGNSPEQAVDRMIERDERELAEAREKYPEMYTHLDAPAVSP